MWLERQTPDRETRVRSSAGSVCCFLEQEIYSPKVLVIPRNRWLRLNMTEKLFTGTLNHNKNKKNPKKQTFSKLDQWHWYVLSTEEKGNMLQFCEFGPVKSTEAPRNSLPAVPRRKFYCGSPLPVLVSEFDVSPYVCPYFY